MRTRYAMAAASVAMLLAAAAVAGAGCGGTSTPANNGSKPSNATTQAGTAPTSPAVASVGVFFVKQESVYVQVRRQVSTPGPAEALKELLKGPSEAEKQQGLSTAIPDGTRLLSYALDGTTAKVDFSEELRNYGGGSARVQAIINQVNNTVMANDSAVKTVSITVAGVPSDESLQP